jgi:hypothetical protein
MIGDAILMVLSGWAIGWLIALALLTLLWLGRSSNG